MWYAVKTDFFREDESRRTLMRLDGVKEVYLPIYRKTVQSEGGVKKSHFVPTISGFMMVNLDEKKVDGLITSWGYFKYTLPVLNRETRCYEQKLMVTRAHLLCVNAVELSKEEIIAKARVPQSDIERLRIFNDRLAEGMEDLRILDVAYQTLALDNDTVLITEGPYIGIEGVIKQVKTNGRKDRRLHFSIGNFTVSVPNVRNYRHIVIREARRGEKARTITAWRNIDRLIGLLQAAPTEENAGKRLRDVLRALNRNVRLDDYTSSLGVESPQRAFLTGLTPVDAGCLISLSRYFQTYDKSIDAGLLDLIPDVTLRPFLTPTPGKSIPEGGDCVLLEHDGIRETVVRVDLRPYFATVITVDGERRISSLADTDEDCTYYAHVAVIPCGGQTLAAVNWGDFMRQYMLKNDSERVAFHADLEDKGYPRMAALLKSCQSEHPDTFIFSNGSIMGFARAIRTAADGRAASDDIRTLITSTAPAAVEMWQGTRLLFWRKLVQRYVLLHKQPDDK